MGHLEKGVRGGEGVKCEALGVKAGVRGVGGLEFVLRVRLS